MKRVVIGILIAVFGFGCGLALGGLHKQSNQPDIYQLFTLVNQQRQKAKEAPLVLDSALDATAEKKCADMASKHYWSHDTPDHKSWTTFLRPIHYYAAGENLALDVPTAQATVTAWMNSPEHRENILKSKFTNVGYAVCQDSKQGTIVVQHFTDMQP